MAPITEDIISTEIAGTLDGLMVQRVRRTPDNIAYRCFDADSKTWRDTSWREVGEEISRWQAALAAEDLLPGDRVAVHLRNSKEWVFFDQAALACGLVIVPLYTDDRPDNIAYIMTDAAVKVLLVQDAAVWKRLGPALAGCGFVIGASARQRSLPWPLLAPRACAGRIVAEAARGEVALMFGNEQSGLSNDELKHCHALVQVPTNPRYSSLNLAMAVQVLAYEIMVAAGGESRLPADREAPLASAGELDYFFDHLERALIQSGFLDPHNPKHLMLRLRRLYNRSELDEKEIKILRGILTALAPGSAGTRDGGRVEDDSGQRLKS